MRWVAFAVVSVIAIYVWMAPIQAHGEPPWPSLQQVRTAALRHAGLHKHPANTMRRRARLAGLLPDITIRADRGTGRDQDLARESSGDQRLALGRDSDSGIEAPAVWKLDRLLYSTEEVRILQLQERRHRERLRLGAHVTTLYFHWRKLLLTPKAQSSAERQAQELAREEALAQLDHVTGGYLSAWLRDRHRAVTGLSDEPIATPSAPNRLRNHGSAKGN